MDFLNYNHDTTHLCRQSISLKEVIHKLEQPWSTMMFNEGKSSIFLPLEKKMKEQNYQAIKRS